MVQAYARRPAPAAQKTGLVKKVLLLLLTLALCGYQSLFFKPELIRQFALVWESFGTVLPAYTRYGLMLVQHPAGWLLPASSLVLGVWAAFQRSHLCSVLAMAGVLSVTLAVAGVFYLPVLVGG